MHREGGYNKICGRTNAMETIKIISNSRRKGEMNYGSISRNNV